MRFALLGPLTVTVDGEPVPMPGVFPRSVLVVLLLDANRVVSADRLIEAVWGEQRPVSVAAALRNHVSRLRQFLDDADRVHTEVRGYRIRVDHDDLDLCNFADLCVAGRRAMANKDWSRAARDLTAALALWRGAPLADVPAVGGVEARVRQLHEDRLAAYEDRIEADLWVGQHRRVIPELRALTDEHPLREVFHRQLMLALYRSGRQAEALDAFQQLRRILVDELGVEPTAEIQALHHRMLTQSPDLAAPQPPVNVADNAQRQASRPAQLPADLVDFTGRGTETKYVADRLTGAGRADGPRAVAVAAIVGVGGIGKTTLAVHVAHRVAEHFPDGQLYVNLHGIDPDARAPGDVLADLLRDLDDGVVPADEITRASRYRSLLADRRVLVVLDNVRDAAQVRPLLPGGGGCAVVITSRNRLSGLAGAISVELNVLDDGEAVELFSAIIGVERAHAEPEATSVVLARCAGLPLAVRMAAARLASRPRWTVAALAERLVDRRRVLDELRVEDVAVRASFQVSYEYLRAGGERSSARVFRLLGLYNGVDISLPAVSALAGLPLQETETSLARLVDVGLAQSPGQDRYQLHELLWIYANELAIEHEPASQRKLAVARLARWCLDAVVAADAIILPHRRQPSYPPPGLDWSPPTSGTSDLAVTLYQREREVVVSTVRLAAAHNLHGVAWLLATAARSYYGRHSRRSDWETTNDVGLRSARLGLCCCNTPVFGGAR